MMSASNTNNHCHLQANHIACYRGNNVYFNRYSFARAGGDIIVRVNDFRIELVKINEK